MPNWSTQRTTPRATEKRRRSEQDWDGCSDMDGVGMWPNIGYGWEDTTALYGLALAAEDE